MGGSKVGELVSMGVVDGREEIGFVGAGCDAVDDNNKEE